MIFLNKYNILLKYENYSYKEKYMNVKVVKFGGSSLADAKQITKAANIIKNDNTRKMCIRDRG